MPVRAAAFGLVAGVCLAAAPVALLPPAAPPAPTTPPPAGGLPSAEQFAHLARTDPVAMLEAVLARYKKDFPDGYRCRFHKQERMGSKLGPAEVIRAAFRERPFAVLFRWEQGSTTATGTLYVDGEDGRMSVKSFIGVTKVDPAGFLPRQSARYSIRDFGLYNGALRTHTKWKAARDAGTLRTEYQGTHPVPELGGRVCHRICRTCDPPDIDNFELADRTSRDPAVFPKEAIGSVVIHIDAETWQQVGSEVRLPNGDLLAAYYFRDIEPNPAYPADQFTEAALRK